VIASSKWVIICTPLGTRLTCDKPSAKAHAESNSARHKGAHSQKKTNGIRTKNRGTEKPRLAGKPTLGKFPL